MQKVPVFGICLGHQILGHVFGGNVALGESVTGRTWIESQPKGAQFDRRVDFVDASGKVIVRANTTWAMIDKASGRLARVRPEVSAPFMRDEA